MKKLLTILLAMFFVLSLAGCTYSYTPELKQQLLETCEKGAKSWIAKIEGAEFKDGELMGFFRIATDGMIGYFTIGEKEYEFYYLSASDEFYTNMYDKLMVEKVVEEIASELEVPASSIYPKFERLVEVKYHEISNKKGEKETEVTYSDAYFNVNGCKLLTSDEEIEERYSFIIDESDYGQLSLVLTVDDVNGFIERLSEKSFVESYPRLYIMFYDGNSDDVYEYVTDPTGASILLQKTDDKGHNINELIKEIKY